MSSSMSSSDASARPQLFDADGILYCDWRIDIANCRFGDQYAVILDIALGCWIWCFLMIVCTIVTQILFGRFRLFHEGSIRGNEGSMISYLICTLAIITYCCVVRFDSEYYVPAPAREFVFVLTTIFGIFGNATYILALVRALPRRYWKAAANLHMLIPSKRLMHIIAYSWGSISVIGLFVCFIVSGAMHQAGKYYEQQVVLQISFNWLAFNYLLYICWLSFVVNQFLRLVTEVRKDLNSTTPQASKQANENRAVVVVIRVSGFIFTGVVLLCIAAILLANVPSVYTTNGFSQFVCALYSFPVTFMAVIHFTITFVGYARRRLSKAQEKGSSDSEEQEMIRRRSVALESRTTKIKRDSTFDDLMDDRPKSDETALEVVQS